jgi:ribonuclease P protein component
MPVNTYRRNEKLKSRKLLNQLFAEGKAVSVFPVKMFYLPVAAATAPAMAGVGVSSRHFKKAVHRNRIKRLLREAYRLNKQPLNSHLTANGQHYMLFFLYIDKQLPAPGLLQQKMPLVLQKLMQQLP